MTKKIAVVLFFSACLQVSFAQEKQLDTLVKTFQGHRLQNLQEKMYAHLDRRVYLTGEVLWFKIYTVDGTFHRPLDVSKVAYVEVLDKANLAVLQAKIQLRNGFGDGSFFLPSSLNSGNYSFRIYTNWMKNFRPDFYFQENISIVNPFIHGDWKESAGQQKITVDFFPEGGTLVAGVPAKVAFRISDAQGNGIAGKGFLLNESNDTITSFMPTRFGIGHFIFTPNDAAKYRAIFKNVSGENSVHPFVEIKKAGYSMRLEENGQSLRVHVSAKSIDAPYVYLLVHSRQILISAELQLLRGNSATFHLNKSELPGGVSHFTIFNEKMVPVCERLYFTLPEDPLNIKISSNQQQYIDRKKVTMVLETADNKEKPVAANLSIAVFKLDSLSQEKEAGIYHHFWLGSDLTGEVESPEYYFNPKNSDVFQTVDNLMLTHGWRRFDWKDLQGKAKTHQYLPEVNGHMIRGVVTAGEKKQRGILTYLGSPGNIIRVYGSKSNQEGEVGFEIKDFYGARRVIIQTDADSTQRYRIEIQNPFSRSAPHPVPEAFAVGKSAKDLLSRSIAMQVQDVFYYEEYGNRFFTPPVDSSAFYGKGDASYFLDDYTRFQVMEEVMREYVPRVFVRKRKDGFHFIIVDGVNGGLLPGKPMMLVDGVPVFDADDIMEMDPLQVKKLEVVTREYYLGHALFSGIVSYSTYKGNLASLKLDPEALSVNYEGLQLQRQFFSPDYRSEELRKSRLPDQRHLLYWNANVVTEANGKQQVEFYTSDVPGTYKVVVESLTMSGQAGSNTYTFKVNASDNQ